jgi:AcrR family transcriptional regulator
MPQAAKPVPSLLLLRVKYCPFPLFGAVEYQTVLHYAKMTPDSTTTADPTAARLPRGPHRLSRAAVAASQRIRLERAITELLAEGGYAAITIGELAARAGVSRGAFYEHFSGKEECLLSAYDRWAARLLESMAGGVTDETTWDQFIDLALDGYLGSLESDPVSARAFIVEMDAAGPGARARRRQAVHAFADTLADRHRAMRKRDRRLGPLPNRVFLGLALGVRELLREVMEEGPKPSLRGLKSDVRAWVTATVEGAAAARAGAGRG